MGANDTRRLRVVVTGESSDAQQALEEVGDTADKTESKFVTLSKTLATWAGRGAIALGAVGAAAVTMGVSTASQLEQVEVGFTTMLGSAEKAQKFMKELQNFAAATPFEFTELVGSAQRFLAMGFAAKDIIPMLTAVGDAVAAMGGSAESVDSVTRALGQMQAKGKVSGEELMQLTEQGIPALQILADSFGVSTGDMSKMIEKGQVMADKAIPALIKGLKDGTTNVKGFGGMMSKQSETMQGKWSTFMDTLQMGLGNIAKNFLPLFKKAIDTTSTAMGQFFAGLQGKGPLEGFKGTINELGLGFRAFVDALKDGDITSDGIVGKFELMAATIRGVIKSFKDGTVESGGWRSILEGLAATLGKLIEALIVVGGWVKTFGGFLADNEKAAWAFWGAITALIVVTKAHATVMAVQAAGGLIAMFKNLTLVSGAMKIATAIQWAYTGAIAAANYLQIAGYLAAMAIQQKIVAATTKLMAGAQIAWNIAMMAGPWGLVIIAIGLVVGAIILLWKHSDTFRNWVLGTLWPSLKRAWEQLKNAFLVVVNAMVTAWNWLRNAIMTVWNAIWGFLQPIIARIIAIFTPIFQVIQKVASIYMAFYNAVWKVVWILIQIAVKVFVAYLTQVAWPFIKWVFEQISKLVKWFYNTAWMPVWNAIKAIVNGVVGWIMNTAVPWIKKAYAAFEQANIKLRNAVVNTFNNIRDKVREAWQTITGPVFNLLKAGIDKLKGWLNMFKSWWNGLFDGVKNKTSSTMDAVVSAFNKGKDGIKAAWDKLVSVTKAPINFVINEVYNERIRTLWNKVAEKFGIGTRLDAIKGFAKGGTVGHGYGNKDDQLALLMRGEGILTTKEMRKLGGPKGFQEFRSSLAAYGNGGVVGGDGIGDWGRNIAKRGKDIIQGTAATVIRPLVDSIRSLMDQKLQRTGFSNLLRGGGHKLLDGMLKWVRGKDDAAGPIGNAGGAMGYKAMQRLISSVFPGLGMISGFRPGATTLSGNKSYHSMGRAVDYPAIRALAQWIRTGFGGKTKELITPWQDLNLLNGKSHHYTGAVWNQHNFAGGNAHVHWAMDSASVVQPGWFMGYNGTGKPETLVNADKFGSVPPIIINNYGVGNMTEQDAKKIRTEMLRLAGRNGNRSGLPGK